MATNFDDYVARRQAEWTPEQWAVYNAACVAFNAERESIDRELAERYAARNARPCVGEAALALHRIKRAPKSRFWFYRPDWDFYPWPFYRGHDEFSRNTIVIGWPITGRIVIATRYCGDPECYAETIRMLEGD